MNEVIVWFESMEPVQAAAVATTATWLLTAAGASVIFLFRDISRSALDAMLGFTGGVMVAASCWSLLTPAIEMSEGVGLMKALPTVLGFCLGALFLYGLDKLLPHLHLNFAKDEAEGVATPWHKNTLLVLAITLHNIPEGLAVGVLFGGAALGLEGATVAGALALAMGIAIQNFPEGLAVSVPLHRSGMPRWKAAWYGQLSAIVEPVAGVVGALAVMQMQAILPYALAFAAGAMIYVVVEEVIPETQRDRFTDVATLGFIGGFALMMLLDVGLG